MQRLHPVDFLLICLLLLSTFLGVFSASAAANRSGLLLGIVTAAFLLQAIYAAKNSDAMYHRLRPLATVAIVFFLYSALGELGMARAQGQTFDPLLSAIDNRLFGFDPSEQIQYYVSPRATEVLAFCYSFFIPYIHLSLFLSLEARSGEDRDSFLTSWCLLYVISYLGYLLVPSMGPAAFPAEHHHLPLPDGYFVTLTLNGVAATGGFFGAFPSLHVGASVFLCRADLDRDKLRTLAYIPIVVGIYAATLVLRYHYVIDLIIGTALALLCRPIGRALWTKWRQSDV